MSNRRESNLFASDRLTILIVVSLLSCAALAWVATYYLMPLVMMPTTDMMSGLSGVSAIVSSPTALSVSIFEAIWIIGMAAMMFPAMIPIVIFYNKTATRRHANPTIAKSVGTPLFLGGYLIVYAVLGLGAFGTVYAAIKLSAQVSMLASLSAIAPAAILIATGVYQFTSLKSRCLRNCISPMGFFAVHYKPGLLGSLRMGLTHGYFCVGCCWAFMVVMLGVGAMSVSVMVALAGLIAVEKVLARGALWFNSVVGVGFILTGVLVLALPNIMTMF